MYACCFVTINTVTYSTCFCVLLSNAICLLWPECQILFFNFDLLHTVRNSWPVFQRKLSRRRLLITVVYFVSHTSARALRLITFTQRSRTTRRLFFIQFLWKPKILNVKDKRTMFERSKGDLGQFSESCNWPLTRAQLNKHMDLRFNFRLELNVSFIRYAEVEVWRHMRPWTNAAIFEILIEGKNSFFNRSLPWRCRPHCLRSLIFQWLQYPWTFFFFFFCLFVCSVYFCSLMLPTASSLLWTLVEANFSILSF